MTSKIHCEPCTCTCKSMRRPGWNVAKTVFRRGQNECSRRFAASHVHAHARASAGQLYTNEVGERTEENKPCGRLSSLKQGKGQRDPTMVFRCPMLS
ncbi:hypothetical protein J6590_042508 [Homalodisca vitripennis]|nr:hypothetical protein J6590_042508 [Homalodisca vitripennis]